MASPSTPLVDPMRSVGSSADGYSSPRAPHTPKASFLGRDSVEDVEAVPSFADHHAVSRGNPPKRFYILCGTPMGGFDLVNVLIVSVCFCGLFTAFNSLQNFVTSLNKSLGFISLGTLYVVFALSNFVAPAVVKRLGSRASLVLGGLAYTLFVGANIHVIPVALIAASALMGFGAAVLWTAQGAHLAQSCTPETLGKFSGLFFAIFQLNQVLGNLLVAVLLHEGIRVGLVIALLTGIALIFSLCMLSLQSEPVPHAANAAALSKVQAPVLQASDNAAREMTTRDLVLSTVRLFLGELRLQMLILPMFYSGLTQTFFFGLFPRQVDLKMIGWLMATFGCADSSLSLILGRTSDRIGRKPVMMAAACCAWIGCAGSLYIHIQGLSTAWFFAAAPFFGFADAGFNTQLYAILGSFFPQRQEAAFAAFKAVQAMSTGVAFVASQFIGFPTACIILSASLVLAVISLLILDASVASISASPPSS